MEFKLLKSETCHVLHFLAILVVMNEKKNRLKYKKVIIGYKLTSFELLISLQKFGPLSLFYGTNIDIQISLNDTFG